MSSATARPRPITLAGSFAIVGSLLLIFSLFDTLERTRSSQARDAINEYLSKPPGDGLGVSTQTILEGWRVLLFVGGGLSAALLIFAIFLLRGDKSARWGFTASAVGLLIVSPAAGLLAFILGTTAWWIWTPTARAWFAGRPYEPRSTSRAKDQTTVTNDSATGGPEETPASPAQPWTPPLPPQQAPGLGGSPGHQLPPAPVSGAPSSSAPSYPPTPSYPHGQPTPYGGYAGAPYGGAPYGGPGMPPPQADRSGRRPTTITIAGWLTIVTSTLTGLFAFLAGLGGVVLRDDIVSELRQDPELVEDLDSLGVPLATVPDVLAGVGFGLAIWSAVAVVLAGMVLARWGWARYALAGSALLSALVSLIAILSIISVVPLLISGVVLILLFTGGANQWFRDKSRSTDTPVYPQPGPPPSQLGDPPAGGGQTSGPW